MKHSECINFQSFFMNRSSYAINYTRGVLGNLSEYWTEYIRAKHTGCFLNINHYLQLM
jgi:hypothetical protein